MSLCVTTFRASFTNTDEADYTTKRATVFPAVAML